MHAITEMFLAVADGALHGQPGAFVRQSDDLADLPYV
jgi:hypothetical protein